MHVEIVFVVQHRASSERNQQCNDLKFVNLTHEVFQTKDMAMCLPQVCWKMQREGSAKRTTLFRRNPEIHTAQLLRLGHAIPSQLSEAQRPSDCLQD